MSAYSDWAQFFTKPTVVTLPAPRPKPPLSIVADEWLAVDHWREIKIGLADDFDIRAHGPGRFICTVRARHMGNMVTAIACADKTGDAFIAALQQLHKTTGGES
jgi:hypothetical protein